MKKFLVKKKKSKESESVEGRQREMRVFHELFLSLVPWGKQNREGNCVPDCSGPNDISARVREKA